MKTALLRSALFIALAVGAALAMVVASLVSLTDLGKEIALDHVPQTDAVMEAKITLGEMKFLLHQNKERAPEATEFVLNQKKAKAKELIAGLIDESGGTVNGVFYPPTPDPELRKWVEDMGNDFTDMDKDFVSYLATNSGPKRDTLFTTVWFDIHHLIIDTVELENAFRTRTRTAVRNLNQLQTFLTGSILGLGFIIFLVLLHFERRKFQHLKTLNDERAALSDRVDTQTSVLRERESRVRAVVDTVIDGIITINSMGTIQTFNPAAQHIFGYDEREVVGKNVKVLMPEPYHSEHDNYLSNYTTMGTAKIIGIGREVTGQRKDGSTFPLELAVNEMDVSGERLFIGITRDITERVEFENTIRIQNERLRERETRVSAVVDTVIDGIITIDDRGMVETFNPSAERIFGYRSEEVVGKNVKMLMPEPYHSEHDDYLKNFTTTGVKKIIGIGREVTGQKKNGALFSMELAVSEMEVSGKRMFTGIVRDITERKTFENTIRRSEARFRDFTETASDWVWEMGPDLRFTYTSGRFYQITGIKTSAIISKTRREFVASKGDTTPEEYERLFGEHDRVLEDHKAFRDFRYKIIDPTGKAHTISINGQPIFLENGDFSGYRGTGTDVTDLVMATQEIHLAKEEAERANRAKSEFLSSMSHELRTPLNAILGFGQLLASDPDSPPSEDQTESIDQILKSGEHLLGLINDVLDLAKIESGNISLSIETLDPRPALEQCINMATSMAKKNKVKVTGSVLEKDIPAIRADQTRFKQVILNFMSNAIKYNREGGSVDLGCEIIDKERVRFIITDTGFGIAKDKQEQLFTPFERLGLEGSQIEGTGIGLMITQNLVHVMDGTVGFESTEGEGSTFWFDLPAAFDATVDLTENYDTLDVEDSDLELVFIKKPSNGRALKVLYIEDNQANLSLMEKIVSKIPNIEFLSEMTAEDGIKTAEAERPFLIFMDINLPGMDGVEALSHLRKNKKTKNIPVVAISAAAMDKDIDRGRDAGFESYLTKPIRVPQIMDTIKAYISDT